MNYEIPTVETQRMVLRAYKREDTLDMFEYCKRPEVSAQMWWDVHASIDHTHQYMDSVLEGYYKGAPPLWVMVDKECNKVIGHIGFTSLDEENRRGEYGFVLSSDYWGKGFMVEAVKALLEYGFEGLKLERIQAYCYISNERSARVLEKVGMQYEGTLRRYVFVKGEFKDIKMFAMTAADFKVDRF